MAFIKKELMERHAKELAKLHKLRLLEFEETVRHFPAGSKNLSLLEIGAGTGYQMKMLKGHFAEVKGIDIAGSNYSAKDHVDDVTLYDGETIPFPDNSFDVIFSSNTLEHVINLTGLENEMKRVLKPGGMCIHIIPSHVWKGWNTLLHYPMLLKSVRNYFDRKKMQVNSGTLRQKKSTPLSLLANVMFSPLHGERGNRFSEIYYFRPSWWRKHFEKNGWLDIKVSPTGVYYSGYHMFSNINRKKFSKLMGSSCYTFILTSDKKK